MKIYISIPISNLDINKVREKADLIKAKLSREGYDVVNPFDVFPGKNPTYEDHICYDLLANVRIEGSVQTPLRCFLVVMPLAPALSYSSSEAWGREDLCNPFFRI